MDDHASLLTRRSGFESWPGHRVEHASSPVGLGMILDSRPWSVTDVARDPPKVADQVRLLARALFRSIPVSVPAHGGFRSRKAGFDSRAGDCAFIRRPRSVPDSHTTLRRSRTRFNSWRGHRYLDAGARRPGDRLQPGSSGFDSHRRLCLVGSVGNLADHSRSKREMLRVRIPPEPLWERMKDKG